MYLWLDEELYPGLDTSAARDAFLKETQLGLVQNSIYLQIFEKPNF